MKIKTYILFIFISFACFRLVAQELIINKGVEELLESLSDDLTEDTNVDELIIRLDYLMKNPLNINTATPLELYDLYFLNVLQIENLLTYIEKNGKILSIYELASIDGFTPDLVMKIEPLISFESKSIAKTGNKTSNDIFLRFTRSFYSEPKSEFSKYEGNQNRYYFRYKHISPELEYGFLSEKDPGEAFFTKSNKYGFDYYSVHSNFKIGQSANRVYVGDYNVRFGQGLVVWQGFAMGKSVEATQVFKSNSGIRSYSSTDENQFFRGVAARLNFNKLTIQPFASINNVDANIYTQGEEKYFSAFQTNGYHRYGSEISGENSLSQYVAGLNSALDIGRFNVGITGVYNKFNVEMQRDVSPYNQFLPSGKDHLSMGLHWKGSVRKNFFYGELAFSKNSGRAIIAGLVTKPVSNLELAMVYRNINRYYYSYFSNAFTESSRTNDENSIYIGVKIYPAAKWVMSAYSDFFKHKWVKYTTASPSKGVETLFQISYSPSRRSNVYLKYFLEQKDQRIIIPGFRYNEYQAINKLRINYEIDLSQKIRLKSRLEFSDYSKQLNETGFLVFQDVIFTPESNRISLLGRFSYFNTDGYNSRIYAYENDLLYTFSIPALYGEGLRTYLNFRYNMSKQLVFWLKIAQTYQFSSVKNEITTDVSSKYELRFQLRYRF